MRATELIKRPVIDLATASTIGRIDDVAVDPVTRRVVGFQLSKTSSRNTWLSWEQVAAVGADAVTVPNDSVLREPAAEPSGRRLRADKVLGGRVLTDEGYELANLTDIDFDPEAGSIATLLLADRTEVPADRLSGIGSYATVLTVPPRRRPGPCSPVGGGRPGPHPGPPPRPTSTA